MTISRRNALSVAMGTVALVSLLLGLIKPQPASADVGVHPILPGGSNIEPEGQTAIMLAEETVTIKVRQATEADNDLVKLNPESYGLQYWQAWYSAIAEVVADFTMVNPTSSTISLTAWFPLAASLENLAWELNPGEVVPSIQSFHVASDDIPVDFSVSELPNPAGADKPLLPWASFPLTFPGSQETHLRVSYLVPLTPSVKGNALALYYVFQTGASWAGVIGRAELILDLPYPASAETMAGLDPGQLDLPYIMARTAVDLPPGLETMSNQARWVWTDFEPTAEDDFSIWLIDPSTWDALSTARADVRASPESGRAWLDLALLYRRLSTVGYNFPSVFSSAYLQPGIESFIKASELWPELPAAHAGVALLTLAQYMDLKVVPPEVMQSIQDELTLCKHLEARYPDLAEMVNLSSAMVEDVLAGFSFAATSTAEMHTIDTASAQQTFEAAFAPTLTSTAAIGLNPAITPEPTVTVAATRDSTPPQATLTPAIAQAAGKTPASELVIAAGVLGVIVLGYFILRLVRHPAG